ncbi:hypothetical protein [Geitlerinema sp. PCC 7407]|uniref:hypothetical protein n=1 Tax=Geitlerinema sp. PCC 7407 TaxID=1173025 RepID=UPI0002F86E50|nr:hypothetical protein [Geitlerinema sp. PCC 7407]
MPIAFLQRRDRSGQSRQRGGRRLDQVRQGVEGFVGVAEQQRQQKYLRSSAMGFYQAIAAIQRRYGFYNYDLMQKAQNLDSDRP